jgi:WD40 repeat protein
VLDTPVTVPPTHPRNHSGHASVLVTRLVDEPRPGSDEICRACEEAWIGTAGYRRADGSWQRRALAFQGRVMATDGRIVDEVFIVDLPDEPLRLLDVGDRPLAGTPTTRPSPPATVTQRRLTFTADRRHPGIQGPRHWLRSSPDGTRIAYLARDDDDVVQIFTVSPTGGAPTQLTQGGWGIASSFTWSPDGRWIACVADGSVCRVDARDGSLHPLTPPLRDDSTPRPEACVVSPDGTRIACVRRVLDGSGQIHNQIFVVDVR